MQSTTHLSSQFHKAFLLPTIRTKRFAKLYYRRCLFGLIRWNKEKDQLQHVMNTLAIVRHSYLTKVYSCLFIMLLLQFLLNYIFILQNPSHLQCILGISTHYLYRFSFKESSKL
ncbi:uncharacterized protein LOC129893493 isoform X1 [Solanum dulcamara]|uniref:uncharacterized protein LOC129893493 isoform X1 n=1 Tax=Solanum dulcamara TaxID=45834 RepID=UPI0024854168|nr:uncharacterized protein LOC129893493 isoform X1 [Solanum dulcamara]